MISPGYAGSTIKYPEAWNWFPAYLNRSVGFILQKEYRLSLSFLLAVTFENLHGAACH